MADRVQTGGRRRQAASSRRQPAADLPVARVAVDISLPHLDRPFDYLVPATMATAAVPGAAVRVRFAGQLTGGFVLERLAASDYEGRLGYLERVVAAEPVLTAEIAGLARAVADRYAGTLADVLRLAVPPRHAAASKRPLSDVPPFDGALSDGALSDVPVPAAVDRSAVPAATDRSWARYPDGLSLLAALADGRSPRAAWLALPGPAPGWAAEIASAVAAVRRSGRGAVVVVPDARDLALVDAALAERLGPGQHTVLAASLGPAERYRRWIAAARGQVSVVAGTRSAMFAPVARLGLVVLWDDGDDLHAEPRAPYPHALQVLALRAHRAGCAALIGAFARTAETAMLVSEGWARSVAAEREVVRRQAPVVQAAGGEEELARDEAARSARLPSIALRAARTGLTSGPVLVQVPRRGYLAAVACERCHARVRCAACGGPAQMAGPGAGLSCGWCGQPVASGCPNCGHQGLRALVTGSRRTAEELGRAFRPMPVLTSGGDHVLERVGPEPAVVVATPGAEPAADGGYSAAILLDGWALLGLATLRAGEEALRRWMNAAALVRPATAGGAVVVVADAGQRAVQALVRWDPATFADRELAERAELAFPPAARMAAVTGPQDAVAALLARTELPDGADVLGPLPPPQAAEPGRHRGQREPADQHDPGDVRYLLRVPRPAGGALALALRAAQAARTAAKEPGSVRIQLDPVTLI